MPPATSQTLRTDPRCLLMLQKQQTLLESIKASGARIAHWEDADGPTECIFLHEQEFKALIWDSWTPSTRDADWPLDECDVTSAYEYQKLVLQVLQSTAPGVWSLKMTSHSVFIETLIKVFPDVRIVWAHRDPFKATGSLCNLLMTPASRVTADSDIDRELMGQNAVRQMAEHVSRPLQLEIADRRPPRSACPKASGSRPIPRLHSYDARICSVKVHDFVCCGDIKLGRQALAVVT